MSRSLTFTFIVIALSLILVACAADGAQATLLFPSSSPEETRALTLTPALPPIPSPSDGDIGGRIERDITYCVMDDVPLTMDIWYPPRGIQPWPVAMFIHGGAWTGGSKEDLTRAPEKRALRVAGFLVVSVNYRLAPDYTFPAMIEDVKCAVRFLRAHASEYGLDPNRIGVWGTSAGGHLAALLGTTDETVGWDVGEYLEQSSRVQAVVDMFGPADLTADDFSFVQRENLMFTVFGVNEAKHSLLAQASPITYVSSDDPPFLFIHGVMDRVVPVSQSQAFYEALRSEGVLTYLVRVKNAGHSFRPIGGEIEPSREEISLLVVRFFVWVLKRAPRQ